MNTADKQSVKEAERNERIKHARSLEDLRNVLDTETGRRVMWWILEECKMFHQVWAPSAIIHQNAAQHDLGVRILARITESNDESFFQMMREAKKRETEINEKEEKPVNG